MYASDSDRANSFNLDSFDNQAPLSPSVPSISANEPSSCHGCVTTISMPEIPKHNYGATFVRVLDPGGTTSQVTMANIHSSMSQQESNSQGYRENDLECRWTPKEEVELMSSFSLIGRKLKGINSYKLDHWEQSGQMIYKNLTDKGLSFTLKSGLQCRNKWRNMKRKYSAVLAAKEKLANDGISSHDFVLPHYFEEMTKVLDEQQRRESTAEKPTCQKYNWIDINPSSAPPKAKENKSKHKNDTSQSNTSSSSSRSIRNGQFDASRQHRRLLSNQSEQHLIKLLDNFKTMMEESMKKEDEYFKRIMDMQEKMQKSQQEFTLAVLDKLALILGNNGK